MSVREKIANELYRLDYGVNILNRGIAQGVILKSYLSKAALAILTYIRKEEVKLLRGLIIKATNEVKLVGSTFDYTKEKVVYVSDIFQEIDRIKEK